MTDDRRSRILGDIDLRTARGLEIGPRHAPLVDKSVGRVLYVDYAPVEEIRATWTKPEIIDPAQFVEVDIVWGAAPLREAAGGPVGYVVASHVIEHVPDLAGWLEEVHAALEPGGLLCLAIPDRRFTFDLFRTESTLADVVEARLLGFRRPSIRQVFDSYARTRPVNHLEAWESDLKARLSPIPEKIRSAYAMVESLAREPRYIDSHCWVFTPGSFLDLAFGMHALGWFPYRIVEFAPTRQGDLEFIVRLSAAGPEESAAITDSLTAAADLLDRAPPPPEGPDCASFGQRAS